MNHYGSQFIQDWPLDKLTITDLDALIPALILHYDNIMASFTTTEGRHHFERAYDKLHAASYRAKGLELPPARSPEGE